MPAPRTPGAPSGNLPHCNNEERRWFANTSNRTAALRLQVTALREDEATQGHQVDVLLGQIRREADGFHQDWQAILGRMSANPNRSAAVAPATARWHFIAGDLDNMIQCLQNLSDAVALREAPHQGEQGGLDDLAAPHHSSPDGQVEVAEEATEEADSTMPLPERPVVPQPQASGSDARTPPPPYDEEDNPYRRELEEVRRQLQIQERVVYRERREAWERQQRLERQNQRREVELREIQRQLQEVRIRPRRTSENNQQRLPRARSPSDPRSRLYRPLSSPPTQRQVRGGAPRAAEESTSSWSTIRGNRGVFHSAANAAQHSTSSPRRQAPPEHRSQYQNRNYHTQFPQAEAQAEQRRRAGGLAAGDGGSQRGAPGALSEWGARRRTEEQGVGNRLESSRFDQYLHLAPPKPLNPYAVTLQDEDQDYYRRCFKYPFNEPPPQDAPRVTEFRKLDGLVPKFSGQEEDFQAWMAIFIPVIHQANCPVTWKAAALMRCLQGDDPRLRSITSGGGATKEDYARIIGRLERAYVHPQGLLAGRAEALKQVKNVTLQDYFKLEDWLNKLESYMDTATSVGREQEIFSNQLFEDGLAKMDDQMAHMFLDWANYRNQPLHAVTMAQWLDQRLQQCKAVRRGRETISSHQMMTGTQPSFMPRQQNSSGSSTCPMDGGHHYLQTCQMFKALQPDERRNKLKEWRHCYACLSPGHNISKCIKGIRCTICQRSHHTLLHGSKPPRPPRQQRAAFHTQTTSSTESDWSEDSEGEAGSSQQVVYTAANRSVKVALQTVPVDVYNGKNKTSLNCLIDPGATGAFISQKAARELQLTGHSVMSTVTGFGGNVTKQMVMISTLKLAAKGAGTRHKIKVQVAEDPAASYNPFDWTKVQATFPHLRDLPIAAPVKERGVDIMLGMDTPHLIKSLIPDVYGARDEEPIARMTKLGWVVGGPTGVISSEAHRASFAFHTRPWTPRVWGAQQEWYSYTFSTQAGLDARETAKVGKTRDDDLFTLVSRLWEVDRATGKSQTQAQDEEIFNYLRENLKKKGNKYELPTLWNENKSALQNNYGYALARLTSLLQNKQMQQGEVGKIYKKQIEQLISDQYAEEVETATPGTDEAYYLPHFGVVRWDKVSTQVRLVMDGAAKAGKNLCLNDCLKKGPKLINELPSVLFRFRLRRFCIAADVKKMFFQILLASEDRDFHRFLWKVGNEVKVFRWKVHPFGSAASPCIAIFTIKEHASNFKQQYPRAAETVIRSTLVDDNLDSCDTEEEAVRLGQQLVLLYKAAGMKLGKIISNSQEVLNQFPKDMVATSISVADLHTDDLSMPVVKTLGVIYLAREDGFTFHMDPPSETTWTKRTILRYEATLYDVHGMIMPHSVVARMILQKLWRRKVGWDEPIPEDIAAEWDKWLKATTTLPQLRVPRRITEDTTLPPQLHTFCDASSEAYAAATYYVAGDCSRMIASKSRVAPLRTASIPRLELMAAELAVDTAAMVLAALDVPVERVHYWTDSTNVLSWMNSESRTLHVFVANRIARVLDQSKVSQWHWVPTKLNPADIPSRGLLADKLKDSGLWWNGPDFLKLGETSWPKQPTAWVPTEEAKPEWKKQLAFHTTTEAVATDKYSPEKDSWCNLSSSRWNTIVGVFKMGLKWRHSKMEKGALEELAMRRVFLSMQNSTFHRTLNSIITKDSSAAANSLYKLKPFLDAEGLLRSKGRLQTTHLPYEQKFPIIIPKDHPWTRILIKFKHEQLKHQGQAHVTAELRKTLWVVQSSTLVKSVVARCTLCRRKRARPDFQAMAPVLPERLPPHRCLPFTITAMDMAGPFYVKHDINIHEVRKAYYILFTCITFRAVHLEPVYDASAQAFLRAFQKFLSRRSRPQTVHADNGANFIGASRELDSLWGEVLTVLQEKQPSITWKFNPPRAPHMGGSHESMIKATKQALYHTYRPDQPVPFDNFATALVTVEGIINSRPLTTNHAEVEAPIAITPAHFLGLEPFRQMAARPSAGWNLNKKWQRLQVELDSWWKIFCDHMQHNLQKQQKWHKIKNNLQVDDVVVVLDKKVRGVWPLGRITYVEPGRDGLVRRVHVFTQGQNMIRAAASVFRLEPAEDGEQQGKKDTEKNDNL